MMHAFLVVMGVVFLTHHVSSDASTTLQNKGLGCRPPAPVCPFSAAQWDSYWREWTCPSTCSDGSTPNCEIEPCATVRCAGVCVNNYCPNHPVKGSARCTASCVQPVNCIKDPCQVAPGQPSLCPRGTQCQADYHSYGCGFTCEPVICTWHHEIYQIHDSRLDDDGCNTCSCKPDGTWLCSKKPCRIPTTATPTTPAPIPRPQCPYAPATLNLPLRRWDCPSTCSDGSQPECLRRPCGPDTCAPGQVCVDNYCPNYPVRGQDRCTANCVTPVTCFENPCQRRDGLIACPGQQCQPDYSLTCGFTCSPVPPPATCTFNDRTYQINETRPYGDGCNTCSCTPNGEWMCTLRPCMAPTTRAPTPPVPPIPAPYCPFGSARLNVAAHLWECPSTCSDGSVPVCPTRPCSLVLCGADEVCVDNMCPGYPVAAGGRCTAQCVKPRTDCVRLGNRTPCDMQFDLRPFCPLPGTTCANDYSVGCNYKCV